MMKFYLCLHNFSELWNLFSRVPMGNFSWCYLRQLFISFASRKYKKDCNILKVILVQGFCPLKTENSRFPFMRSFCEWRVQATDLCLKLNWQTLFQLKSHCIKNWLLHLENPEKYPIYSWTSKTCPRDCQNVANNSSFSFMYFRTVGLFRSDTLRF